MIEKIIHRIMQTKTTLMKLGMAPIRALITTLVPSFLERARAGRRARRVRSCLIQERPERPSQEADMKIIEDRTIMKSRIEGGFLLSITKKILRIVLFSYHY